MREYPVRFCERLGVRFPHSTRLICAFRYKRDAERFYRALVERLAKFGLALAEEKTRIIRFTRFRKEEGSCFEFLGFEFRWGVDRRGRDIVKRRTSRKKVQEEYQRIQRMDS